MQKDNFLRSRHQCRPATNRRTEQRLLCSDLVKVRWIDRHGARREEIVVLEGYSASGANLFMGVPIGEGTPVTLWGGGEELRATVRHCTPGPNGYLAGVHFGERPRSYVPEHLLDLSRLIHSEEP
jgi:hypothetical protein